MEDMKQEMTMYTIQTTIGELISAISDAAQEATVDESELSQITHLVFHSLLSAKKD